MTKWLSILLIIFLTSCASIGAKNREKADLHLRLAVSHIQSGDYPAALTELLRAQDLDSENAAIQNNLGLVYFFRDRSDLAENHLKKAISLFPGFTDARNNLARIYIEQGRHKEAELEIKKVLDDLTYPNPEKGLINLGLIRFNTKQYREAQVQFAKAIKSAPDDCVAHTYYGRSLFEQKNYSSAAEALDRAISFCQKIMFDEPHYFSALAHYRGRNANKAVIRFQEIIKYYPDGKYREKSKSMLQLMQKGNL